MLQVIDLTRNDFSQFRHTRDRLRNLGAKWYELPETKGRISAMEGMRGLAVLLVFCVHYHQLLGDYLPRDTWQYEVSYFFGQIGHSGVDLFFILSGYLIYGATIRPNLNLARFWRRRIERIYPTFLIVFAIYLTLSYVFPEQSKIPVGLWPNTVFFGANLLLMAGLVPVQPLVTVAWSLSFEVFYYLTLPLLIWVTGMQAWSPFARINFLLGLAAVYIVLFATGPLLSPGYWTTARMLMFLVGILLYERLRSNSPQLGSAIGEMLVTMLFVASLFVFFCIYQFTLWPLLSKEQLGMLALGKVLVIVVPFYLFGLYCFGYSGALRRAFEWYPLRWLGNMSYSYYLIHGLVVHFVAVVAERLVPAGSTHAAMIYWIALPFVLAATLVVSTALFLAIERPLSLQPRAG